MDTRQAKGKGARKRGSPPATETTAKAAAAAPSEKPLTSYDVFELCIQRARNLIKLHEAAHGKAGKPEKYTADAHRAAVVLAVSALDAFVRDLVVARIRLLLARKAQALPSALTAEIKKFLKDDGLLEAARADDLLERVEKAFRSDFERRSFQGTKNIEEQLRLVGYDNVFHEVAVRAGLNEDRLREDLDNFTARRHAIAHRGDFDLTERPPREKVVTKKYAEDCIRLMCRLAKQMQDLGDRT